MTHQKVSDSLKTIKFNVHEHQEISINFLLRHVQGMDLTVTSRREDKLQINLSQPIPQLPAPPTCSLF